MDMMKGVQGKGFSASLFIYQLPPGASTHEIRVLLVVLHRQK
jgi:hypothetical protein